MSVEGLITASFLFAMSTPLIFFMSRRGFFVIAQRTSREVRMPIRCFSFVIKRESTRSFAILLAHSWREAVGSTEMKFRVIMSPTAILFIGFKRAEILNILVIRL